MLNEITEQEQQKLNTGRSLRAETEVLFPLLGTKQALVISKLVAAFRAGQHEQLLPLVAELSTLDSMRSDITRKIKEAEAIERKLYDDARE